MNATKGFEGAWASPPTCTGPAPGRPGPALKYGVCPGLGKEAHSPARPGVGRTGFEFPNSYFYSRWV